MCTLAVGVSREGHKSMYTVGVSQEGYKGVYTLRKGIRVHTL